MKRLLLCISLLLLWCGSAEAVTLELASVREISHPTIKADETFAEAVEGVTDGMYTVTVGSAGQLYGDEKGILDAVIRGDAAFGQVSVRVLAEAVPSLEVFALPYLVNSSDHLQAVLYGEIGHALAETIEEWIPEVKVLAWYNCGGRCFYTRKQVASPFDMPGLTLCAENTKEMQNYLTVMGAKHQWLARHTVYSAIFQGVIDGAENDLISLAYLGDYDPARYILLDRHTFAPDVLLISRNVYDLMDETVQASILSAAVDAEQREWELAQRQEQEALKTFREFGCSLTYTDNGVREAFVSLAKKSSSALKNKSVYDLAKTGNRELIQEIEALGKSYPPEDE
ncbi:MAG: TRAP transporter substrate-binding protein DctP [Clostridia bacterium]|nr:TRAP transporter substrate-binding protein DctP [Clostridia bacterium]